MHYRLVLALLHAPQTLSGEQLRQLDNEVDARLLSRPSQALTQLAVLIEREQLYRGYFIRVYHGCRRPWTMLLDPNGHTF